MKDEFKKEQRNYTFGWEGERPFGVNNQKEKKTLRRFARRKLKTLDYKKYKEEK